MVIPIYNNPIQSPIKYIHIYPTYIKSNSNCTPKHGAKRLRCINLELQTLLAFPSTRVTWKFLSMYSQVPHRWEFVVRKSFWWNRKLMPHVKCTRAMTSPLLKPPQTCFRERCISRDPRQVHSAQHYCFRERNKSYWKKITKPCRMLMTITWGASSIFRHTKGHIRSIWFI